MSSSHSQLPGAQRSQDFFGLGFDSISDPVAYPHLSPTELEEVAPFGERCIIAENDPLVSAGDYPFNSYVILSGTVRAVDISTGERVVFVRYGAGYFSGDIDLFTRRPSIVSVEAETDVEAIRSTSRIENYGGFPMASTAAISPSDLSPGAQVRSGLPHA